METIVVKIGGVASDNLTKDFFKQVKKWKDTGKQVVIVHGGGYYITEMMNRLNIPVTIDNGLRVTTKQALKVTQMVLIGQVQPAITSVFQQYGFSAIGLHASCNDLIQGEFIDQEKLGYVGEVTKINSQVIEDVLASNYIPIITPLGMTIEGDWLNINADAAASKIAEALNAEELYLLTDVPGVKKDDQWLPKVSPKEIKVLKEEEIIIGGMIPKIESAMTAIFGGVGKVHITNGIQRAGTVITKEEILV
ncbi:MULTISPECIES: acetylglutamate kinase [Enterococcus]|uniref:Acetylglutamate kinase n=1 Tax=Enterococcus alishanensis TaxID=1303817 RepID=A0ABS6TBD6_9ENTE|nr:acetylglutamate kinase [Enterococcus alishanensis]MBV7390202.1 acetylglutamate kinase [Enterococcus alishanensis]